MTEVDTVDVGVEQQATENFLVYSIAIFSCALMILSAGYVAATRTERKKTALLRANLRKMESQWDADPEAGDTSRVQLIIPSHLSTAVTQSQALWKYGRTETEQQATARGLCGLLQVVVL